MCLFFFFFFRIGHKNIKNPKISQVLTISGLVALMWLFSNHGLTPAMPMLEGFRIMVRSGIRWTRRRSDDTRKHMFYPGSAPLLGNDLRPACLTLLLGCLQWWCLQRGRRLDLAEGEELLRIRALGWKVEKCLEPFLDLPPNLL
jgi:hypothetical protein